MKDIKDEQEIDNVSRDGVYANIALSFDKGRQVFHSHSIINNKKEEVSITMKGAILLALPMGEYPKACAYDTAKLNEIVKKAALDYFPLDESASELLKLSLYPTR